jgi:hypothetical protein
MVANRQTTLTLTEVEQLNELTDEDILDLSEHEVHALVEGLSNNTLRLKDYVTGLDKVYDRIKKLRYVDIAERFSGKVLEYEDLVVRVMEAKPATPYKQVLAVLVKTHPELKTEVDKITKRELRKKAPASRVYRHKKAKEPKVWLELEHERIRTQSKVDRAKLPAWLLGAPPIVE